MPKPQRQQQVLDLLKDLRGIDPLKKLFWEELSYERVNQPLSRRGWTDSVGKALADDPVLFAGGGDGNAFHVIYCRLASDKLLLGGERPVVSRLLNEHPYDDRFGGCGLGHGAMERPMPACTRPGGRLGNVGKKRIPPTPRGAATSVSAAPNLPPPPMSAGDCPA